MSRTHADENLRDKTTVRWSSLPTVATSSSEQERSNRRRAKHAGARSRLKRSCRNQTPSHTIVVGSLQAATRNPPITDRARASRDVVHIQLQKSMNSIDDLQGFCPKNMARVVDVKNSKTTPSRRATTSTDATAAKRWSRADLRLEPTNNHNPHN